MRQSDLYAHTHYHRRYFLTKMVYMVHTYVHLFFQNFSIQDVCKCTRMKKVSVLSIRVGMLQSRMLSAAYLPQVLLATSQSNTYNISNSV